MPQLENIESIEKDLWSSADSLRANSNFASNDYFLPVMGLIFLRHAYSRFLNVKKDIEASLPTRGGKTRPLTKEDFSRKSSIFLREESQFDYLVNLPDTSDRAQAIYDAMEAIEQDYESLSGVLPKEDYKELDNEVIAQLLRNFNNPALKEADGDVFGRIYEYFLTEFAGLKAHDGGEFFTPVSIVETIVNVIEPDHGKVLDPACGSAGMFVQSAHFIERLHQNPAEKVTFYGLEKNPTTIRLAKMNLAVHGLEGNIQKAITYYEDPHNLQAKANFVMANPPFNVDEVDAEKVKSDSRLPFGLPGVNKEKKVSNGNYLWISYFYSYLNEEGRAGFVMSSQASSAGNQEATVRQKLIETGHVDAMMAIRSGFFYTRTVPCELWFLDKGKPEHLREKVLMIDARNVYRKVTRTIYDFSPEQMKNLSSIVWLYRGQTERFLKLVEEHLERALTEAANLHEPLNTYKVELQTAMAKLGLEKKDPALVELQTLMDTFDEDLMKLRHQETGLQSLWGKTSRDNASLLLISGKLAPLAEQCRDLIKQADHLYKLFGRLLDTATEGKQNKELNRLRKDLDESRKVAVTQLKQTRYFYQQAHWLQERFPDAVLRDVEGLVKLVDHDELERNDWSLTPGRYVGVAPEIVDEDFDFEATLREIHIELNGLNQESQVLAEQIARNFEELGV